MSLEDATTIWSWKKERIKIDMVLLVVMHVLERSTPLASFETK